MFVILVKPLKAQSFPTINSVYFSISWSCFRTLWSQILACCNFRYTVPDLQPWAHCTRITLLHTHMHVLTNPLSQVSRHPFTQIHTHKRMQCPLSCRKAARRDSSPVMLLIFCRTRFFFSFLFFLNKFSPWGDYSERRRGFHSDRRLGYSVLCWGYWRQTE